MAVTNTVALQFDGLENRLEGEANQAMGFANLWTICFWLKPTLYAPQAAQDDHHALFHLKGTTRRGEILIWGAKLENAAQEEEIHVELWDEFGKRLRVTRFNTIQKRNEWRHFSCVWNGTNLIAYDQGLPVTDQFTSISGDAGMSEPTGGRSLRVGDLLEDTGPSLAAWSGILGHIGIWNDELGPTEFGPLVSGGFSFDLLADSGLYTSSANLVHYWKPGDDFPNVGYDYAGNINLASGTNATATGINSVVLDQP